MFKKAERKKAKLRLALCGTSGSGKTYSSLMLAKGLGGRVAMIDTERGSGELYSHLCEYDICQIEPPFTVNKYIDAIHAAENLGYEVIIIDSLTHAWAAEGGLLDIVDKKTAASTSKNSYYAWRDVTPMHNALIDAMLQSSSHIIATMRTKTAYETQDNERGKKTPVKIGLAPVQREGMDYEFTVVFDVSAEKHIASVNKDRTGLFDGEVFLITPDTGHKLRAWLDSGVEPPAQPARPERDPDDLPVPVNGASNQITDAQRKKLFATINETVPHIKNDREVILQVLSTILGREIASSNYLTSGETSTLISNPDTIIEFAPTEAEYQKIMEDRNALIATCETMCKERSLPMEDLLTEMFPTIKRIALTSKHWKDFYSSLMS